MRRGLPFGGRAALGIATALCVAAVGGVGFAGQATAAASLPARATFNAGALPTWQTNGIVWATAYANGVVYVGGTFTKVRPPGAAAGEQEQSRTNFAAFDAATGALLPCAPTFTGGAGTIRALHVSADGKILYVGGSFGHVGSVGVASAVALNTADCTLRSDFRPQVDATVRAIDVTPDAVYLGGDFTKVNGETREHAAAVSPAGTLLSFDPSTDLTVRALTAAPADRRVYIGGDFNQVNGKAVHALAAVNSTTGATVQTFPGWIESRSVIKTLINDGTHFFLGAEGTGHHVFDGRIEGNLKTGAMVWKDNCYGATQALATYQGVLYSGSHAHDCSPNNGFPDGARHHLLAESISNKTLLPWFPNTNGGIGEKCGPRALTIAGDELWVGGEFTTVNGKPQQSLTRFSMDDAYNRPPMAVPSLTASSPSAGKVTMTWKSSWDKDDGTLTYYLYRDGQLAHTVTASSRFWDRPNLSWTDTVASGSRHHYSIAVSDGIHLTPRNGPVYVTAR